LVKTALQPKVNIKQLKTNVVSAEKRFNAKKEKFPDKPESGLMNILNLSK
jgi:hypothetical protein